ncbi:MAG: 2-C-methyl-D-erythritol 4-phosphate cytidylyltransferase [Gammaproteobacteria bacterium]|nr:2-C-methyl-D-erythritol 4-phosphate cytidylyltransferase [Gammaproteobacteria bacterium]
MSKDVNLWVVIPAAGVGKRMRVNHPKQYLKINHKTVLEHTISCFSSNKRVKGIVVATSPDDEYWPELDIESDVSLFVAVGGEERCHSVLSGLEFLANKASVDDWVMVHDAARPCLHEDDIQKLIDELWLHGTGGLLGLPVADTLKFCGNNGRVKRTVSRDGLWRALTPQMFRYGKLVNSLKSVINEPNQITDEASAIEAAGYEPVMIEGRWDNIKITHPQDLDQAIRILHGQQGK